MKWYALLFISLIALAGIPAAQARTEPDLPSSPSRPGPAYAIADEQFVSGTLRDQHLVETFLLAAGSPLADAELVPVAGRPMAAPAALVFLGEAYSVSPSLLLALAEMEFGVLSGDEVPPAFPDHARWLARTLSRWFYDYYYRVGAASDGGMASLNAGNGATYALRNYFNVHVYGGDDYPAGRQAAEAAAWEGALAATYTDYFGSPWAGRLVARQPDAAAYSDLPELGLPWRGPSRWYFTGGPHSFDGSNRHPLSGVDFQPEGYGGCNPPLAQEQWVAAAAGGRTTGYQRWWVKIDHDYDGDVASGWQTVYGHLAEGMEAGMRVSRGYPLGHPSCYGGFASGVHVHFGVKFENVWQPITAFTLSGWSFERAEESYGGWMVAADGREREACYDPDTRRYDCTRGVLTLPAAEIPAEFDGGNGIQPR